MNERRMGGKIEEKTYARIGLMGNPSDGFYGKTISSCITNFCATITLMESEKITITAHNKFDRREFDDLGELETTEKNQFSHRRRSLEKFAKWYKTHKIV